MNFSFKILLQKSKPARSENKLFLSTGTVFFQKCFFLSEMFRFFKIVSFLQIVFSTFSSGRRRNKTFSFKMAFPPSESLGQPCIFLISLWFPWIPTWDLPKKFRFSIGFSTFNSGQRRNETFLFQKCFILSEMFRYFKIVSFFQIVFSTFNIGRRRNKTFFFQISFILSKVQRFFSSRPGAK